MARSGAQSALDKSLVQGKRKINKAKQRCGIPVDHGYDGMWNFNYTSTGFTRSSKEGKDGKENRDGYLDQSHDHWSMVRGKDPQLDLYNPRMKVQVPTGNRECWKVTSASATCKGMCNMIYKCKLRYLKEQSPFRCKHNKLVSNLNPIQGGEQETKPPQRPMMAHA